MVTSTNLTPASLHQSILQGLRDVIGAHVGGPRQIGDRSRDLAHAVVPARAEAKPFDGRVQQDAPLRVRPAKR